MTAKDTNSMEVKASPFTQISDLENEQETRVQATLAAFAEENRETEKNIASHLKGSEERFRAEATAELRDYAKKEPALILTTSEEETTKELKGIAHEYEKNGKTIAHELARDVLELNILAS